jgi:hypothetical protein
VFVLVGLQYYDLAQVLVAFEVHCVWRVSFVWHVLNVDTQGVAAPLSAVQLTISTLCANGFSASDGLALVVVHPAWAQLLHQLRYGCCVLRTY